MLYGAVSGQKRRAPVLSAEPGTLGQKAGFVNLPNLTSVVKFGPPHFDLIVEFLGTFGPTTDPSQSQVMLWTHSLAYTYNGPIDSLSVEEFAEGAREDCDTH